MCFHRKPTAHTSNVKYCWKKSSIKYGCQVCVISLICSQKSFLFQVERPIIFLCSKEKKTDLKRAPRKDIEDATKQLQIQTYQAVNAMWKRVGTLDVREKLVDESLLKKWNHDPLMDNRQLVLMVFEQDEATGKPSFSCTQNLPRTELGDKDTLPKTPGKELKVEQIYSRSDRRRSSKAGPQVSRWCEPAKNLQQVSCTSHTNISLSASISEATMLFADHGHLNESAKPEKKKSGFKIGPDPTQLSSVLLELRDEVFSFHCHLNNTRVLYAQGAFPEDIHVPLPTPQKIPIYIASPSNLCLQNRTFKDPSAM